MVELKIGRKVFNITEKDVVLFNGACWQLMTQEIFSNYRYHIPTISKTMCEKFVKKGILVMFKKEREYTTMDGKQMGLYYYKFDMDKLNDYITQ